MLNGEYIFGLGTKVAVEETSKMYKMTLVSLDMADWCPHIEMMFHHNIGTQFILRSVMANMLCMIGAMVHLQYIHLGLEYRIILRR